MENQQLPFEGEGFKEVWNEWIQFRKERRLKKYVPIGLKKTFSMLLRISENDEQTAIAIINQSIEQGYQGLFPLKQNNGAIIKTITGSPKLGTSAARVNALRNW